MVKLKGYKVGSAWAVGGRVCSRHLLGLQLATFFPCLSTSPSFCVLSFTRVPVGWLMAHSSDVFFASNLMFLFISGSHYGALGVRALACLSEEGNIVHLLMTDICSTSPLTQPLPLPPRVCCFCITFLTNPSDRSYTILSFQKSMFLVSVTYLFLAFYYQFP